MATIRMVRCREEVVKKKVLDAYEMPSVKLSGHTIVEVMNDGNGPVVVNGTILQGTRVRSFVQKSSYPYIAPRDFKVSIILPRGEMTIDADEVIVLSADAMPRSAKLVETVDAEGLGKPPASQPKFQCPYVATQNVTECPRWLAAAADVYAACTGCPHYKAR